MTEPAVTVIGSRTVTFWASAFFLASASSSAVWAGAVTAALWACAVVVNIAKDVVRIVVDNNKCATLTA
ncbi:hypothetical protein [Kaistia sp. MMO-174]|uniref:hypothetical protein n=1 Tax=Kaistia sp. MMO-174 TaxID=3081256 RepID=UPI001ACF0C4E|nr:hypothetical protein [Hyphomicrobiales bacterium]MBN9060227.1 hypothetical protein [Hyphomicrobiales bacterium]